MTLNSLNRLLWVDSRIYTLVAIDLQTEPGQCRIARDINHPMIYMQELYCDLGSNIASARHCKRLQFTRLKSTLG